jgi:hypothetical protein
MNDLFDKAARASGHRAKDANSAPNSRSRARGAEDRRVIAIRGAREHNLKDIDLDIPRDHLVVFTGLSGSGKSSLAFDTIYAEGQRRYVESLSAYARQFLEMMQKPDVDQIDGLSPAISIEQKTTSRNPRSTVGTVTEIYDYMRLLWARVGVPYSPATGLPIESQTISQMADRIMALPEGTRLYLLAPVVRGRKGEYRKELAEFMKKGYQRVKIDGKFYEIADAPALDKKFTHDIDVVIDRLVVRPDIATRLADSLEQALRLADGLAVAELADDTPSNSSLPPERGRSNAKPPRRCAPTLPFQGTGRKRPSSRPQRLPMRAVLSSPKNSPARFPASPFPKSSRGCSPSTIRSALARNAAGWASSSTSIPIWSSLTRSARYAAAPFRRGRNRARPITCRRCRRSVNITASRWIPSGRTCRKRRRTASFTVRAIPRSASPMTTACAPMTRAGRSKA